MPVEPSEQPKKRPSLSDLLEAGILVAAAPVLLTFLATAFLPLQRIASVAPLSVRPYLADGKNVGPLLFAVLAVTLWPVAAWRRHRRIAGYHPKGTYQPGKINIWVAELEGDSGKHDARKRMISALSDLFHGSVAILRADICPQLIETEVDGHEADAGNKLAQEYLEANQGDMLLWGQSYKEPVALIELRVVSVGQDGNKSEQFEYDRTTYKTAEKRVRAHFAAALAALVTMMADRNDPEGGAYLSHVVRPLRAKIQALVESLPSELSYEDRAGIFYGLGVLDGIIGKADDNIPQLRNSFRYLLRARRAWRRANSPSHRIAKTQAKLTRTLAFLGDTTEGTKFPRMCVYAADSVLLADETDFTLWAECKTMKIWSLFFLGWRQEMREPLEIAAAEADDVLKRPEIRMFPRRYNKLLAALSAIYAGLGKLDADSERFALAAQGFRELTKSYKKNSDPLDWANAQLNLAVALSGQWTCDSRKELLEGAWVACERAFEVFSPTCSPGQWGKTHSVVGHIYRFQCRWEEAAEAYLKALTVLSEETDRYECHRAQEGLTKAQSQMWGGYRVGVGQNERESRVPAGG